MALTREKKEQIVEDLKQKLDGPEVIILTEFQGLSVPKQQTLRNELRDTHADYHVVKNTLTKIALKDIGRPVPEQYLLGPTSVTLLWEDIAGPTQTLLDFAKETGTLSIKGGILGDRVIGPEEVEELADLPPREVLLAQLLGAIQGPASSLVRTLEAPAGELARTLQAPLRELAMTIQAYADKER